LSKKHRRQVHKTKFHAANYPFVFWRVLWLNDTSYSKSLWRSEQEVASYIRTQRRCNFSPSTPTLTITMHIVTDRQTDWRTDRRTDPQATDGRHHDAK